MFCKQGVFRNFAKFTGKHLCQSLFFNKVAGRPNQQLANELHKPIIRSFIKRKVYSSFKDNIWGVDLANMELISKYNKGISIYYVLLIFLVNMLGLFL